MLANLRKISNNFVFKTVIFLIIFSFIAWGIGDIIRNSSNDNVITINNKYFVTSLDFQRAKANYINHLQNMWGTNLTSEQLQSFNINNFVINYLIDSKLFEAFKNELKLEVSDDIVINQIRLDQNFFDENQQFNKGFFKKMLESNHLSETQLEDIIKNEKAKEFIINTLTTGMLYPQPLKEILAKYLGEKRDISIAIISKQNVKLNPPKLKDLEDLYKEKLELFTIPEFRKISYIEISPEIVQSNVKISDGEIKEEYKNYIAENYSLEKRDIYNLVIKDKEKAEEVFTLLKAGHDFTKAAEKYSNRSPDKILMKGVTKSDLPAEFQNEAFNLNKGDFSKIIATNSGYHIIKVEDIHKVSHPKYEVIREDLYKNLVKKKAEELIYEYIKDIEDLIASNSKNIKDLAKEFNLSIKTLEPITYEGYNHEGAKVQLPDLANIQNIIFSKNLKELELIEDTSSSRYFIISVEDIQEKKSKDFAAARSDVLELWTENEVKNQIIQLSNQLKQKIKDNNSNLPEAASSLGLNVENRAIYRNYSYNDEFARKLPEEFLKEILSLGKQGLSNIYPLEDTYIISQVNNVSFEKTNAKLNEEGATKILQTQYQNDYIENLIRYLRNKYSIKINKNLIR